MAQPNVWEFPGGKVETGETDQEALIREIREELGCVIEVFSQITEAAEEYSSIIVQLITYRSKIVSGHPSAKEHSELKWVHKSELSLLNWSRADRPTVRILSQEL
ncbi:(deoxy)nucleoside triphosphate pyrophosphohydrolase [Peribacillus deserti]|uniref:(deoxy)nucleoside triphosphate pyrophosphohydrolase n=1 Tax=Peribacillus deserti TaxID=673318 RepID=UPI0026CF7529|nr:(deoxy)nucleoside triphosphate pyrophosphohydrolase [Peribacillus deserti]